MGPKWNETGRRLKLLKNLPLVSTTKRKWTKMITFRLHHRRTHLKSRSRMRKKQPMPFRKRFLKKGITQAKTLKCPTLVRNLLSRRRRRRLPLPPFGKNNQNRQPVALSVATGATNRFRVSAICKATSASTRKAGDSPVRRAVAAKNSPCAETSTFICGHIQETGHIRVQFVRNGSLEKRTAKLISNFTAGSNRSAVPSAPRLLPARAI